jgi:dCMP deaminase
VSDRWDRHFLGLAENHARMSKDPSTKVGSVIIGPDREIRSAGFNGFPRGIADTTERLTNRDEKMRLVVHAEMNAVLAAARVGIPLKGCSLYLVATDASGAIWGGPPCTRCTVEVIQAGISHVVTWPFKSVPSKWLQDIEFAKGLLHEAGIGYREVTESDACHAGICAAADCVVGHQP